VYGCVLPGLNMLKFGKLGFIYLYCVCISNVKENWNVLVCFRPRFESTSGVLH
jgi:hypothetical protein